MSNNQLSNKSIIRSNLASAGRYNALGNALPFIQKICSGDYERAKKEFECLQIGTHKKHESPYSSIIFFLNSNDDNLKEYVKNYEACLNHKDIEFSSESHATSCMASAEIFPAVINHMSLAPKVGFRISAQIQVERNKTYNGGSSPKEVIAPLNQDPSDPLHELIHGLVEKCLQNASKGASKDTFGSIGKEAMWFDYNVKKGKECEKVNGTNNLHEVMKQSMDHMGNKKSFGSFPDFFLNVMKVEKHDTKDFRVVFVGPGVAFCPHNDTGHLHSSDSSMTIHMHLFMSKDYVSGDIKVQPEDLLKKEKSYVDAKGAWEGHLGEVECVFCKSSQKLLIGDKKNKRKRLGKDNFMKECPDRVMKLIKKHNPDADIVYATSRERKKKSAEKNEDEFEFLV